MIRMMAAAAVILTAAAPAFALDTNSDTSRDLIRCSVLMKEMARTSASSGSAEDTKALNDNALAYEFAATAYMPDSADDEEVKKHFDTWTKESEAELAAVFETDKSYEARISMCEKRGEDVQAVMDVLKQAQPQN